MSRTLERSARIQYALLHGFYWSVYCGVFGYAVSFLLSKGFPTGRIGIGLAGATLLSGLLQPLTASFADRHRSRGLKGLLLALGLPGCLCLGGVRLLPAAHPGCLVLYVLGALLLDMLHPLLNALCGWYGERGVRIHYGTARGTGSIFYAVVSLGLGGLADRLGGWVILVSALGFFLCFLLLTLSLPGGDLLPEPESGKYPRQEACGLGQFFQRYPRFCASMVGVVLMLSFHAMSETYLIHILERVGGGSRELGAALAVSTCFEIPILMLFPRFRRLARTSSWMKLSALSFLLKALALGAASHVAGVILAETLQMTSFGIYAVCAVEYAGESVHSGDAVKGQAMVTSACALGAGLGNFLGGQALSLSGASALLACGVTLAAAAAVVLFLTVKDPG